MTLSNRYLVAATILLLGARLSIAYLIDLTPQEAYYWNYAIHPALSYFDHPPMVAWVIRAGCFAFGKSELGVRFGGYALTLLSTGLLYLLGRFWFNQRAGLWAAFLFQIVPLFFVYGILITPDVPLVFFWLLSIYCVSIAVRKNRPGLWYFAGAALGCALLSKYSAAFLLPSTLLFLLVDKRYRGDLWKKEPYLAMILALLIFSPVIIWNAEHNWASFTFQVSDRLSQETKFPLRRFYEFVLIQLGVTSPTLLTALFFIPAIPLSLGTKERRDKWRFALLFSAPLLAFLLLYSMRSAVKPNWPLPGYLSLLVAAYPGYRYLRLRSSPRLRKIAGTFLTLWLSTLPVMFAVAVYHSTVTIPRVPVHHWTTGWRELGKLAGQEAQAFESTTHQRVFLLGMDSHYIASALSFYEDGAYPVFSRNVIGRPALAFAYWKPMVDLNSYNALAVDINPMDPATLRQYFTRVDDQVRRVPVTRGNRTLYYFYMVRCFGYKGVSVSGSYSPRLTVKPTSNLLTG